MATITKTFTENQVPNAGASKWTISVIGVDAVVSDDTFTFTTPTIKVKYVGSNKGYGNAQGYIYTFKIGGTQVPETYSRGWVWYKPSKELAQTAMTSGTTYTLTKGTHYGMDSGLDYNAHTKTLSTSTFFNSGNKTSKSLNVTTAGYELRGGSAKTTSDTNYNWGSVSSSTGNLGTLAKITLDAPPTFNHTDIYYDKTYLYSGVTTASIDLSNISAKYGGDIVSATFKIGSDTKTLTGNITSGTLSILLTTAGTFVPVVSVTDSRGQVTTEQLPSITVLDYKVPSISSYFLERTLNTGIREEEVGTYAVIDVTLAFSKELTDAKAPIVEVTDNNGVTLASTVTWYSTRANNGALSGSVSWSNLSSGGRVYGLVSVTSGFSSQNSYQISVTPSDNVSNGVAIIQTLGSAFYTIDFLAGGHGIAFGKPASKVGFECDMDTYFNRIIVPVYIPGLIQMYGGVCTQEVINNKIVSANTNIPSGWLLCDGSILLIDDYPELAAVLGSTYGGNGTTTFGLPDFRGRTGVGVGTGTSTTATEHTLGQTAGSERVTLTKAQIPEFAGSVYIRGYKTSSTGSRAAIVHDSTGIISVGSVGTNKANGILAAGGISDLGSNPLTVSFGNGESHNNMQPYIGINYIIATGRTY